MYANGKGVAQDYAEARKWFEHAADHGEVKAQSNLGALYATGKGVPQSYVEAAKWYGLAAKRGDEAAGSVLEKIRSVQARDNAQYAQLEEHGTRVQMPAAPQPSAHIEPMIFRFSPPLIEHRTIRIGSSPFGFHTGSAGGFHMMGGHFGRR